MFIGIYLVLKFTILSGFCLKPGLDFIALTVTDQLTFVMH